MPYGFPYRRTVTLTSKGQITLPVELRRSWNLRQGDQLDFVLTEDGAVHVRKHVDFPSMTIPTASRWEARRTQPDAEAPP